MKKKALSVIVVLALCLSLIPSGAFAASGSQSVSITKTSIQADSVFITEGYGSLTLQDESWETAPQYALIDGNGNYVFEYGKFPCQYQLNDGLFVNGIVTQQSEYGASGVYSLFDLNGRQAISNTYDYLEFYGGYGVGVTRTQLETQPGSAAQYTDTRELIDSSGKVIQTLPDGFNLVISAGGGIFEFETQSWGLGYFGNIGGYGDGLLWVFTGSEIKNNISEAQGLTEESQAYQENWNQMACYGGPYCGYIDLEGNVVIPPQYYSVYGFSEGLAAVQEYKAPSTPVEDLPYGTSLGGDWKYIDKTGKTAFSGTFSDASPFVGGYAYVANNEGKYGYIDTTGKVIIPMTYDSAYGGENGLFSVGKLVNGEMQYGLVDENNQIVVPLEYDDISGVENGTAYAIKDGLVYVIKTQDADEPSSWAAEQVNAAISAGIVPENLQGNYTSSVSRGDVAEMFIRLIEESTGQDIDTFMAEKDVQIDTGAFTDTTDENVLAANALGIISGVGNNRFDPDGTFTRAQIAAILNRLAGVLGVETEGYSHSFTDVAGHWSDDELGWPVHAGIISGVGDNRFDPDGPLTTEQAIAIAYRALEAL